MKKNGFIATSILYAFFLVFITLFIVLITAYAHNRASVLRINEKVKEELKGIRNRTLADLEVGDSIKFTINPDQSDYLNENGTWMVATKSVASNGYVTITFVSDREVPNREYVKIYEQDKATNDYSPYHRGIEAMEKAILYDNYTGSPGTSTHINNAIYVSKAAGIATTVNIDFFTMDTFMAIKAADTPQYIKDNLINVGSDYIIKNGRTSTASQISINGDKEAPAHYVYKQCFLNREGEYPNGWAQLYTDTSNRYKQIDAALTNGEVTRPGYYRLRFYNFGANIDSDKLMGSQSNSSSNNSKYAKAARLYLGKNKGKNTYIFDTNLESARKGVLEQFYADYCGAKSYEDYETNKANYPLTYVSTTYDAERGTEYIDWCYNANTYPYKHLQSENVIVYQADYNRCDLTVESGYSDFVIGIGESNQSTYTEQNIRLQMTIVEKPDKVEDGKYYYYHDYILAGNGTPDNIFVYTNGVKS